MVTREPSRKPPTISKLVPEILTSFLSYWDWTLDSANFAASPLWDPVTGFGGNGATVPLDTSPFAVPGATGGGCVTDGPFANFRLHLGPGASLDATDRCLKRGFSSFIAENFSSAAKVNNALAQGDYGWFNKIVEGETNFINVGIHGAGHYSIGGEAGDLYASPGGKLPPKAPLLV